MLCKIITINHAIVWEESFIFPINSGILEVF